ncbi:zinc finger CCCH domain-containing protein 43 [Citrus sinensis]|uniref:Zinc finger CCCH domain-containing protein 43 n=1 Tax=Citrus sinensis TaxID=2711 RepID=A0ACB8LSS7_CITSI|nr:zinc finger CCCH domain-containing protein 43 [Citrus sinensis]
MELSELISVPNLNHEKTKFELGLQSSSPKSDLDPPPSDLDYTAGIEEELRNLDLREAEEIDSIKAAEIEIVVEEEDEDEEEEEESESDENNKSNIIVQNEIQNENEYGNQMRKRYPYPVRPDAQDCTFYMKTGTCKFGSNCKFNHPVRRKNQSSKEKVKEREELIERPGQSQSQGQSESQSQIECKYYLRTGGCKFGKACRFNHTRAKSTVAPVLELNFLGLPIRPGEKECPYYMRNGSCKYGANCRFNHPDPTAVGGSDSPSGYGNGGSVSSQAPSQASIGSWSSPRALNEPAPFVPMMYSPTPGVPSQNSEWNGYQSPLYPQERSVQSAPTYVINNNPLVDNVQIIHQPQMLVGEFPERPGQPECSYFLRTGDCKYKSNCKYHHPKNRIPKSPPCTLSDKGLPLRPGQNVCSYYSRYGICKFGPACKYDHPIHPDASAEYGLDPPPSFGDSTTRQETGMAGTGNGNGGDKNI